MRQAILGIVLVALALVGVAHGAEEAIETRYRGEYLWESGDARGKLEIVFKPTGEESWDVAFHFNFQGPHTFVGTAEGSLVSGKLEGTVVNERETRTFAFRGTVKKGKFRGMHFEATGGLRRKTGTLSMKAVD